MKRISAICLMILVCSNSLFAVDERVEVKGRRPVGEGAADGISFGGGNPTGGGGGGFGGGSGSAGTPKFIPSNEELVKMAIENLGQIATEAMQKEAWANLKVTVKTPNGLEVTVELELGFGQAKVKSKTKK